MFILQVVSTGNARFTFPSQLGYVVPPGTTDVALLPPEPNLRTETTDV